MSTNTTWAPHLPLRLRDAAPPITPRDHQIAAWDRLSAYFQTEGRQAGLVVVPTGGGKTVLAAHWLLAHHIRKGGRVLWLAHRRSLLRQAMATFRNLGNLAHPKASLLLAAVSSTDARWATVSREHDVVFSSFQTAVLEANEGFVQQFVDEAEGGVFVVVDEAHHAPAPSYARLLRDLKKRGCKLLGLTATPVRTNDEDGRRLSALFDARIVYQITRRELTERGILAAPAFETVETHVNVEKDFTPADYAYLERYGQLGPAVLQRLGKNAHRNKLIVEHYAKKKETYGPTIVFANDTMHAMTLAEEFQKKGISADYVDYTRKDAEAVIERYRTKRSPDVLVNVEMLTEGFDAPHTRTVFIARPTRSEGLLAQMVGRALRGRQSGGNAVAHLVTFLDTWSEFDVLDAKYELDGAEDSDPETQSRGEAVRVPVPPELVREAYRLLQSNVRGQFTGVHQCLPHGWYAWNEVFEDDQQWRSVMVFDNQVDGFRALLDAYATPEATPAELDEDGARALVRAHFGDVPDPLPRWSDIKALLDARRKGCEIVHYTFDEKEAFDPRTLASELVVQRMDPEAERARVQKVWDESAACRMVYRDDIHAFLEDVSRERTALLAPPKAQVAPEVTAIVPQSAPRAWPPGEAGHSLVSLRDNVLSVKRNFPNGAPVVGELRWSERPNPRLWGFFRYSDRSITINRVLQSPDIPPFVLEYLMFHEMLHAEMPSAGHNRDFRARERSFTPSPYALGSASARGIRPGPNASAQFWYVSAARFLDTFDQYYLHKAPGSVMEVG